MSKRTSEEAEGGTVSKRENVLRKFIELLFHRTNSFDTVRNQAFIVPIIPKGMINIIMKQKNRSECLDAWLFVSADRDSMIHLHHRKPVHQDRRRGLDDQVQDLGNTSGQLHHDESKVVRKFLETNTNKRSQSFLSIFFGEAPREDRSCAQARDAHEFVCESS